MGIDARRLAGEHRRLGWEYVDPGMPLIFPFADNMPRRRAVDPYMHGAHVPARFTAKRALTLTAVTLLAVSASAYSPYVLLVPLILAAVFLIPLIFSRWREASARAAYADAIRLSTEQHAADMAHWQAARERHDSAERERLHSADIWFPIQISDGVDRLDVIGGLPSGWQYFLATLGYTLLSCGQRLLVVDLTEQDHGVADGLRQLIPPHMTSVNLLLPGQDLNTFMGISPSAAADLLADALGELSAEHDDALNAAAAEILHSAIACLDGGAEMTFARLAAALAVLSRRSPDSVDLTDDERSRLVAVIDDIGTGPFVEDRVRALRVAADLLHGYDPSSNGCAPTIDDLWCAESLTQMRLRNPRRRAQETFGRVLLETITHRLRLESSSLAGRTLVLAGADHISGAMLDRLARAARRRDIFLIILLEQLRDDFRPLIGSARSATVFMRLGNGPEAMFAAEQIGRQHRFVVSQLTQGVQTSDTFGFGTSSGATSGSSSGLSISNTENGFFNRSATDGVSFSTSVGRSTQRTENWSRSQTSSASTTDQRTYEFVVEPTELQQLAPTAFIVVEGSAHGPRARFGDCNPAIGLAAVRVAQVPRRPPTIPDLR